MFAALALVFSALVNVVTEAVVSIKVSQMPDMTIVQKLLEDDEVMVPGCPRFWRQRQTVEAQPKTLESLPERGTAEVDGRLSGGVPGEIAT
jgi:hypothetical protein